MARGGGGGGRGGGRGGRGGHRHSRGTTVPYVPTTRLGGFLVRNEGILISVLLFVALLLHVGERSEAADMERRLSDFASAQYNHAFSETDAYEDNLLLLLVVHEDRSDFSYMTWVGDHIGEETFAYLQGEGTWLDDMLSRQFQSNYTHSLSGDLHSALRELADQIDSVTTHGSHTCTEGRSDSPTYLRNLSRMELNEELIEGALDYFRQETLIPIVLVIAEADEVFG